MIIEYMIDISDIVAFHEYMLFVRHKNSVTRYSIIALLLTAAVIGLLAQVLFGSIFISLSMGFAAGLLANYATPLFLRYWLRSFISKQHNQQSNTVLGPHHLEFRDGCLYFSSHGQQETVDPETISEAVFTSSHLFLFFGADNANIVPRNAVATSESTFIKNLATVLGSEKLREPWVSGV